MKKIIFLLVCILLCTCRLQPTNGCNDIEQNSFAVKVFRDYYKMQPKYTKTEISAKLQNTSDELCDSVLKFIENQHKRNTTQFDTLYVIKYRNDGQTRYFDILYQGEVLHIFCKLFIFYGLYSEEALDTYSDVYISILENWSTGSLKKQYIWDHFSPLTCGNVFVTRLIYSREKLITANKVHHLDFDEMERSKCIGYPIKEYPPKKHVSH